MQKRLLTEKDLTFTGAIDIAHGMESAAYHAKALQGGAQSKEVHKLNQHSVRGEVKQCYKCGQSSHRPTQCSYKSAKCHNCGKLGHLKKMCRQGQHPPSKQRSDGKDATKKRIGTVRETSTSDSEGLYTISDKSLIKPFTVDVKLNGKPLSMELDTGATVSLISQNTFK